MDKKRLITFGVALICMLMIITILANYSTLFGKNNKDDTQKVEASVVVLEENDKTTKPQTNPNDSEIKFNENGLAFFEGSTEVSDKGEDVTMLLSVDKSKTKLSKEDAVNIMHFIQKSVIDDSVFNGKINSYTINEIKEISSDGDSVYYATGEINGNAILVMCSSAVIEGKDVFGDLDIKNDLTQAGGAILGFIGESMQGNKDNNSNMPTDIWDIVGGMLIGASDSLNNSSSGTSNILERYQNFHGTSVKVYVQTNGKMDFIDKMQKVIEAMA